MRRCWRIPRQSWTCRDCKGSIWTYQRTPGTSPLCNQSRSSLCRSRRSSQRRILCILSILRWSNSPQGNFGRCLPRQFPSTSQPHNSCKKPHRPRSTFPSNSSRKMKTRRKSIYHSHIYCSSTNPVSCTLHPHRLRRCFLSRLRKVRGLDRGREFRDEQEGREQSSLRSFCTHLQKRYCSFPQRIPRSDLISKPPCCHLHTFLSRRARRCSTRWLGQTFLRHKL